MEIRKMGLIPSINHSQLIDEATLKVNSKHGVLAAECLQARFWHSEYVLKKYCDNNNNKLRNKMFIVKKNFTCTFKFIYVKLGL